MIQAYGFESNILLLSGIQRILCFRLLFCLNAKGNSSNDILTDVKECTVLIHSSSDNLCLFLVSMSAPSACGCPIPNMGHPLSWCDPKSLSFWLLPFDLFHFLPWEPTLFGFWPKLSSLAGTNEYLGQSRKNTSSHRYLSWNLCPARPAVQLQE